LTGKSIEVWRPILRHREIVANIKALRGRDQSGFSRATTSYTNGELISELRNLKLRNLDSAIPQFRNYSIRPCSYLGLPVAAWLFTAFDALEVELERGSDVVGAV
jgi:hypothetical protein